MCCGWREGGKGLDIEWQAQRETQRGKSPLGTPPLAVHLGLRGYLGLNLGPLVVSSNNTTLK